MFGMAGQHLIRNLIAVHEEVIGPVDALLREAGIAADTVTIQQGEIDRLSEAELTDIHKIITSGLSRHVRSRGGDAPLRAEDWRVFRYCLSGARTLRDALIRAADCFAAIDGRLGLMSLVAEHGLMQVRLDARRRWEDHVSCAVDLAGIVQLHALFGWLIDAQLPVELIALDHEATVIDRVWPAQQSTALRADLGWTGFAFPGQFLDYPVVRVADGAVDWSQHSMLWGIADGTEEHGLARRIRAMMIDELRRHGRITKLREISERLGLGQATIRRRLIENGTSYSEIKTSCRRELALEFLRMPELTIEVIAAKLDFCDSDAFRDAFRGWLDMPPTAYRATLPFAD
jgi:AraC-type DNA-binding domain-containing proteins